MSESVTLQLAINTTAVWLVLFAICRVTAGAAVSSVTVLFASAVGLLAESFTVAENM